MLRKKKKSNNRHTYGYQKIPDKSETKRNIVSENFYQQSFIYLEELVTQKCICFAVLKHIEDVSLYKLARSYWICQISWKHINRLVSSVTQLCLTLCDPVDCSMPGFPVHHQLLELTQTHGHQVSGAIQPSHPLSSTFPPALQFSQHQGLFQWVVSLHQVDKVLELQLWHQSFQWIFRTDMSFRIDWLDCPAVQWTLESLLWCHS